MFLFMAAAVPVLAQEAADVPSQAVDRVNPVEQVLPRWKSSLGEIQEASAVLLETNSALTSEHDQLKQDLVQLQGKIDTWRRQNAKIADEMSRMQARSRQADDPAALARLKGLLAQRELAIKAQQDARSSAQLRRGSAESRVALLRAQMSAMDITRQEREVDMKAQDIARIQAVKAETERVKDRAAITDKQVQLLSVKTQELARLQTPYLPEARNLARTNGQIKERVQSLLVMKAQEQSQMAQMSAQKNRADADVQIQRLRQLLAQRDELQARLKDATEKLEALKALKPEDLKENVSADEAQAQKFERQNAFIEDEIGNLRENIALLEYKLTTLERYNGRNKPAGKVK